MALGLAHRQGWWRSCSAGAIFPRGAGGALHGPLACPGAATSGARGSRAARGALDSVDGTGAAQPSPSPHPQTQKTRPPARCGTGLGRRLAQSHLFLRGEVTRGWTSRLMSSLPDPRISLVKLGVRSPCLLSYGQARRLCFLWPGWRQGMEAFPSCFSSC